jgi:hypothetical protein
MLLPHRRPPGTPPDHPEYASQRRTRFTRPTQQLA